MRGATRPQVPAGRGAWYRGMSSRLNGTLEAAGFSGGLRGARHACIANALITGWAQVNGLRGETETIDKMAARIRYDLDYLRNWSLRFDLYILFKTLLVVVHDRHAY